MPDSSPETHECTRCAATSGPRRCTNGLCRIHDPDPKLLQEIPKAGTDAVARAWWEWDKLLQAVNNAEAQSRGVDPRHVSRLRRGEERLRSRAEALTEGVVTGALPDDPGARYWLEAWAIDRVDEHDIERTYPINVGLDVYHACCVTPASTPCRHTPDGLQPGEADAEACEGGTVTLLAKVVVDMCSGTTYNAYLVVEGLILDWMASAYGQPSVPLLCQMAADWVGRQEAIDCFELAIAPGDTGSARVQARLSAPAETWEAWQYGAEEPGYLKPVLPNRPAAYRRG